MSIGLSIFSLVHLCFFYPLECNRILFITLAAQANSNLTNTTQVHFAVAQSSCTNSWRSVPPFADVFKFTCPKVAMTEAQQHPRYADPDDCQYFYVCINGDVPRRNGCKMGQVFNDVSKTCDWPRNVPEWWVQRNSAGIRGVELPGTNTCRMGARLTQSKYWLGYVPDGPSLQCR